MEPPDLAAALDADAAARARFDGLSTSNRGAVVALVTGAKTDETRQRRIEKAMASLRDGELADEVGAMKIGAIVPQGWHHEYDGWDPLDAWRRTTAVAQQAEQLGFESIWLFDHFHTIPRPTDEITFESFTALSALAALTSRVRLGHMVICTAFRNPALTAKMISTMDAISGGRMELGIGAGWKRDEWLAYGYGYPETRSASPGSATTSR